MTKVVANMAARVISLDVEEGELIQSGRVIAVLESMKMEIPVSSTVTGVVHLKVEVGDEVADDTILAEIEEAK